MAKLSWDGTGQRFYETGVDHAVLFPWDSSKNAYGTGVAWSGISACNEAPSGAEATDVYADNIKYASIRSTETYSMTIEAYTYPDEFAECDGSASLGPGIKIGQQTRKKFGYSFRSKVGNDTEGQDFGYIIHLVYGCTASPSSKDRSTINDSPDISPFSWEVSTEPVEVEGLKPTATLEIDSTKVSKETLTKIEEALYGTESEEPKLLMPNEIVEMLKTESGASTYEVA